MGEDRYVILRLKNGCYVMTAWTDESENSSLLTGKPVDYDTAVRALGVASNQFPEQTYRIVRVE